ncbi:MAG: hypothetical protein KAS17_12490, partial [Victivallaceae bacterium]|nr:hypothetical protein [Victivallaceae bacterium]
MFIDALRKNKYKVVDIEGLSTKRVRGQVDKMILLAVYNKRSIFLPVKKQAAFDLNIVLAITDISKTKAKKHTLRYFTSWGRSIVPCDYEGKKDGAVFMKKNYTKATLQAINHLFY